MLIHAISNRFCIKSSLLRTSSQVNFKIIFSFKMRKRDKYLLNAHLLAYQFEVKFEFTRVPKQAFAARERTQCATIRNGIDSARGRSSRKAIKFATYFLSLIIWFRNSFVFQQ